MQILIEDNCLRIVFEKRSALGAVVSFSGGDPRAPVPPDEFRQSLHIATTHSIYYIVDKQRHWFNSSYEVILDMLSRSILEHGFRDVYTVGGSMGGFGALMFAGVLPNCVRSVTFGAQSAMMPEIVPFETRWQNFRVDVPNWVVPDVAATLPEYVEHVLMFGAADPLDMRHSERFFHNRTSETHIWHIAGGEHAVAATLKRHKVLNQALAALVTRYANLPAALNRIFDGRLSYRQLTEREFVGA